MGPLQGIKVLEIKGLGPGPYAGMLLADMGADVIVVERLSKTTGVGLPAQADIHSRGKRSIALDLKTPEGISTLLKMVGQSDVLFECFRPGVAERLGFGPEVCHALNSKLIYGRLTGWGQTGPLSQVAGHDLNFIALTGALAAIGNPSKPSIPLNLIGDYAGGSLFLVMGILAALVNLQKTGQGQVIDAAIVDGSASLMSLFHSLHASDRWTTQRNANFLDGGAHFYNVYETSDSKHISIAAIEPQFYALLLNILGLDASEFGEQHNTSQWPEYKEKFKAIFLCKTSDEWCSILQNTDVCFAPVLNFVQAPDHSHLKERQTYFNNNCMTQPAPAPRFSRASNSKPTTPRKEGSDTANILEEFGFSNKDIENLRNKGALS